MEKPNGKEDKNTIRLPRQQLPLALKSFIIAVNQLLVMFFTGNLQEIKEPQHFVIKIQIPLPHWQRVIYFKHAYEKL